MTIRVRMEAILEALEGPPLPRTADGLPQTQQKDTNEPEYHKFWNAQRRKAERRLKSADSLSSAFYSRYMRYAMPGWHGGGSFQSKLGL